MKTVKLLIFLSLIAFWGCDKDTFFDKFVPEIMFYENNDVENADFSEITLGAGITADTIKARISAPMKLKEIKLFKVSGKNEELLQTYNDFRLTPNVYKLKYLLKDITSETVVKVVAWDNDNKLSSKIFTIKITQ